MSLTRKSGFTEYKWQLYAPDIRFNAQQKLAGDVLALSEANLKLGILC